MGKGCFLGALCLMGLLWPAVPRAATARKHYFAHDAVEDRNGVIAPWYKGQNGQFDLRVRIAAETMKRYPWVDKPRAVTPGPEYLFNGKWKISREGQITVIPE